MNHLEKHFSDLLRGYVDALKEKKAPIIKGSIFNHLSFNIERLELLFSDLQRSKKFESFFKKHTDYTFVDWINTLYISAAFSVPWSGSSEQALLNLLKKIYPELEKAKSKSPFKDKWRRTSIGFTLGSDDDLMDYTFRLLNELHSVSGPMIDLIQTMQTSPFAKTQKHRTKNSDLSALLIHITELNLRYFGKPLTDITVEIANSSLFQALRGSKIVKKQSIKDAWYSKK